MRASSVRQRQLEGADYRNGFGQDPGGAPFSFKKWHSVFPQNRYFQEAGTASGTGLVQPTVQIVASHDLTLVRPSFKIVDDA